MNGFFSPEKGLQWSARELGVLLWWKLFFPCTLFPFPNSLDFASLKEEIGTLIWEVLQKLTWDSVMSFFIIYFAVQWMSWDSMENHEVEGVTSEGHWTFHNIPFRVQDQHCPAWSRLFCMCLHFAAVYLLIYFFSFRGRIRSILWKPNHHYHSI